MNELGALYGNDALLENLRKTEPVVYTTNGNRSAKPATVLKKLEAMAPLIGVTRVAQISELAFHRFPVFQSSRPNILCHTLAGQNSGAQGKGETTIQAKISCLMETLEHYCGEPRQMNFIRASFDFLKDQHVVADPKSFVHSERSKKAKHNEPLVWTQACWIEEECSILIPAETVFFPFFANDYDTRSLYPLSSNGMAAGATYLEAVIHGLYEVVERHYQALWGLGVFEMEPLLEDEVTCLDMKRLKEELPELKLKLFASQLPGVKNLPVIVCTLTDADGISYTGCGCSGNVDLSLMRAISEALQTVATINSGSREDVAEPTIFSDETAPRKKAKPLSSTSLSAYRKNVHDRHFKSLQEEYRFLKNWIHQAGFPQIFVVNLTRHNLEIPVVRVVVPGLHPPLEYRMECQWTANDVQRLRYHY